MSQIYAIVPLHERHALGGDRTNRRDVEILRAKPFDIVNRSKP